MNQFGSLLLFLYYSMLEINKIYNQDCIEGMKLIDDKSIDLICCDLPYNITKISWDSLIPFNQLWEQYKRIIKPNGNIQYYVDGHKIETHEYCDKLLEYFYSGLIDIIR